MIIFLSFYFQLNTLVKHVEPETLRNGQTIWMITYQDLETNVETTRTFDAVVVCNGHYTVGHIPHIPGIESFPGESIHSHQYRVPEMFARKKVCILGASWSGIDIAMEISQYAEKVNFAITLFTLPIKIIHFEFFHMNKKKIKHTHTDIFKPQST